MTQFIRIAVFLMLTGVGLFPIKAVAQNGDSLYFNDIHIVHDLGFDSVDVFEQLEAAAPVFAVPLPYGHCEVNLSVFYAVNTTPPRDKGKIKDEYFLINNLTVISLDTAQKKLPGLRLEIVFFSFLPEVTVETFTAKLIAKVQERLKKIEAQYKLRHSIKDI